MADVELQKPNSTPLLKEVFEMIVSQRRGYADFSYPAFILLIESNIKEICETFNTRWLISICDTIADSETESAPRAMMITTYVGMIKMWGTDIQPKGGRDPKILKSMRQTSYEIWDGIITMRMSSSGDAYRSMMARFLRVLKLDPVLLKIFETILRRVNSSSNPLSNLISEQQIEKR
mgnify:CR=1 FL=1|tara:strand:- start:10540 stop:11070 length:531 start_codon:yes stop_codon:yes gene_type:complete